MGSCAVASGGFGDVWKGTYDERHVAIKALRVYKHDDMHKVKRVALHVTAILEYHPLIDSASGLLQGGYHVETVVASQHCPISRSYRCPRPILDCVGVDAERGHTELRQESPRCRSVATRML